MATKTKTGGLYPHFPADARSQFSADIQRIIDAHYGGNASALGRDCGSHASIVWRWRRGQLPSYATIADIAAMLPLPVAMDISHAWLSALVPPILLNKVSIVLDPEAVKIIDATVIPRQQDPPSEIAELITILRKRRISPNMRKSEIIRAVAAYVGVGYSTVGHWVCGTCFPAKKHHASIVRFVNELPADQRVSTTRTSQPS